MSQDARDEIFSDGMTEELISALSKIAGMRVIARTSVMRYKNSRKPIGEIGKELNVSAILEGSVRKAGDKIRISIQLADPETEEQLWSEKYDRNLEDIFARARSLRK
jgi:TolB-like protein